MPEQNFEKTYIVDTSVVLDDVYSILLLSDGGRNRVIVPETTLDEIDSKKTGFGDINFQAREFNRLLDRAEPIADFNIESKGETLSSVQVKVNGALIEMISKKEYKDYSKESSNIINDRKILEVARHFPDATIVSNDTAMRIRAKSMRLKAEPLLKDRHSEIEDLSFIETIYINSSQKDLIETYTDRDFEREFSNFTNVEFICDDTGEHILTLYKNHNFHIIDEKKIRSFTVKPRNKEQLFFMNMLLDKDLPIVVCAGVTGSGKNLLSLQGALAATHHHATVLGTSIKYCRNTITAGDTLAQLGFLKGDEAAKLKVFVYPLFDAIGTFNELEVKDSLARKKVASVLNTNEFMEKFGIEIININQMRGVNLKGFLIFDEWQNSSSAVNKLMLTRVVDGSKVVIIGDLNQIDHPHLSKYNNALAIMLKHAKTNDMVGGVTMSKVVRGKIAEFAEKNL